MQVSTIQDREQKIGASFRGPGVLHTSEYTENCLPNWRRKSSGHFPWGYKVATSLLVPYMRGRPGLKVCSFRITLKANSMVVTSSKTQKLNFMLLLCGTCCKYNAQSSLKIFAQKYLCIGVDTDSILQKNIFAFTKTVFERRYFEIIAPTECYYPDSNVQNTNRIFSIIMLIFTSLLLRKEFKITFKTKAPLFCALLYHNIEQHQFPRISGAKKLWLFVKYK